MTTHKNKPITPGKIKLYKAYLVLLSLMYIYTYHLTKVYGDFLDDINIDVLGNLKCSIQWDGCEKQMLNGYGLFRMAVFFGIGCINPHSHIHIGILSVLMQIYAILLGSKKNHVLNPLLNMAGYTLGSLTCRGC